MWILQDEVGGYSLWNMWEGRLSGIMEEFTIGPELKSIEEVVVHTLCNIT
jgi:hypothetical protein